MVTMIRSLPSAPVSRFGSAGPFFRRIFTALADRRARIADEQALRDMDPRLLDDIGAARRAAGPASLAMLNPGAVACSLFSSGRSR